MTVLAFRIDGKIRVLPNADEIIRAGTAIVVLGPNEQLVRLQKL